MDSFMKNAFRWLPTWVDSEHVAWAAHCALGSALQLCMPSSSSCPIKDLTVPGASDQLRAWYDGAASACTSLTTESACVASSACDWQPSACPPISDDAALQIDSVTVTDASGRVRQLDAWNQGV
jgi:hypothetical protein